MRLRSNYAQRKLRNRRYSPSLALEALEDRMVLATFFVTNGNDAGAGSLRQAVADANSAPGADVIEFTGVTNVTLTSGQLTVTDSVAIDGASAGATKVTVTRGGAAPAFRIFSVNDGTNGLINVSMNNLRITNGDARDEADVNTLVSKRGGGVDNTENLTITNSVISGNFARRGGGISHRSPDYVNSPTIRGGTLTLDNTEVTQNDALYNNLGRGGAMSSIFTGKVTISNSEFNDNTAYLGAAFETSVSVELEMRDSEISSNVTGSRAIMYNSQFGAAATPATSILLERVTVENNSNIGTSVGFGALHISQDASMTIRESTIRGNQLLFGVSVIPSVGSTTNLAIERSTITQNPTGGVIANLYSDSTTGQASFTVVDSSIINNGDTDPNTTGGYGLLVLSPQNSTISNSTISGNQAEDGGAGLYVTMSNIGTPPVTNPRLDIISTTITNNRAQGADSRGGGIEARSGIVGGFVDVRLRNSIVSGNFDSSASSAPDIFDYGYYYMGTPYVSGTFSLIGDNSYTGFVEGNPDPDGNIVGGPIGGPVNAQLGALADNGGPTLTHMPQTGSPVINRGDNTITGCDQRGFTRSGGAGVDIGSVESDGVPCATSLNLDFNLDGLYNCDDMNLLEQEIDSGTFNALFDVNNDGVLNSADVFQWLLEAGELRFGPGRFFRQGDANLDGAVDGSDFGIWNASKFTATDQWCQGDFNQDNSVDGSDFGIWNANKFTSSDAGRNGGDHGTATKARNGLGAGRIAERVAVDRSETAIGEGSTLVSPIQLRSLRHGAATNVNRIDQTFAAHVAQPRAAEPFAAGRKMSLTDSVAQSRTDRQDAHDEVMKLFELF